jgi:flagellar basal body-associated protein FliL
VHNQEIALWVLISILRLEKPTVTMIKLSSNYQVIKGSIMIIIMFILVLFYLAILQRVFKVWLKFFQQDSDISPQEKRLSWFILIVGAILWPLVVPISYLGLLEKKLKQQNSESNDKNHLNYYTKNTLPIT